MRNLAILFTALPGPALACLDGQVLTPDLTVDLLMDRERAGFEEVFAQEMQVLSNEGLSVDDAFAFARCDLARVGQPDLVIFATGAPFCEQTCGVWAIRESEAWWEMIFAADGPVRLAASTSMGQPDIVAESGGLASIHKYDGTSYRETLDGMIYGEVFELPTTEQWQTAETGFVGLAFGDPGPNGEAVQALAALTAQLDLPATGLETALASLNADEVPEVIIEGKTPELCGPDGCRTWIFRLTGGNADLVADEIVQGSVEVAATATAGWRDLIAWSDAGARVLRWTGTAYK